MGSAGVALAVGAGLVAPAARAAARPVAPLLPAPLLPADVAHHWVRAAYRAVLLENLTPPAAARAYSRTALAMYEAVVAGMPGHRSLAGQLSDLRAVGAGATTGVVTAPGRARLDWHAALSAAAHDVLLAVLPLRAPATRPHLDAVHAEVVASRRAAGVRPTDLAASLEHGSAVAARLADWCATDGHAEALARPYTPPTGQPWLWESTPPNFRPAIEPWCGTVRPLVLQRGEVGAEPPVPFSTEPGSAFHDQALAVLEQSRRNGDEERAIARFWTDNPGSFTPPLGTPTGLPSGHWMLVAEQVARGLDLALDEALEAYVRLGVALNDAFLACWTVKYETNLLRPVTYLNRYVDPAWTTVVNTPQFPEHTSGHSVSSAAAAVVLTDLLGEVAFTDDTHAERGYPARSFTSFDAAAREAAVSRLYGGIHYPRGIEAGLAQGEAVGRLVLQRLRTRR
ncbi:vanadium-dependent haloperoxidase [Aquipuribacter nitratireducens]|uniref:Vanadium-dependent haloperoxidase n=1 Tax=Aquipuribacter nitratireducens TaxID=650104 RepID=A0ABW0GQP3_9MICO